MKTVLLLVLLGGCRIDVEVPPDGDGDGTFDGEDCAPDDPELPMTWFRDQDGDGFGDPTVSLDDCAQPEFYVGNDLDCNDGDSDQLPDQSWYPDADEDGYGAEEESTLSCLKPEGHVTAGGDCDDTDPERNPSSAEHCDTIDNNCDGQVDEGLTTSYYADADADDFGDPDSAVDACDQPDGHVENASDCDDTNSEVHPEATEVCRNGQDDNCDGQTDICDYWVEDGVDAVFYGPAEDSQAGCALSPAGDINGDGWTDLLIGAWGHTEDEDEDDEGAAYVVFGPISPLELGSPTPESSLGDADVTVWGGAAEDMLGETVLGAGDLDSDGYDDLVVSTLRWDDSDTGHKNVGGVYVLFGPIDSGTDLDMADEEDFDLLYTGDGQADWLGGSLATGDLDGDGLGDLVLGAAGREGPSGESNTGGYYIVYGDTPSGMLDDTTIPFLRGEEDDSAGQVADVADLDGDGMDDLVVGVRKHESSTGAVYYVSGPVQETGPLEDYPSIIGADSFDQFGTSLALGDTNEDGYIDLLVGAPENDSGPPDGGSIYLYHGDGTGEFAEEAEGADLVVIGGSNQAKMGNVVDLGTMAGSGPALLTNASTSNEQQAVWFMTDLTTGVIELAEQEAPLASRFIAEDRAEALASDAIFLPGFGTDGGDAIAFSAEGGYYDTGDEMLDSAGLIYVILGLE